MQIKCLQPFRNFGTSWKIEYQLNHKGIGNHKEIKKKSIGYKRDYNLSHSTFCEWSLCYDTDLIRGLTQLCSCLFQLTMPWSIPGSAIENVLHRLCTDKRPWNVWRNSTPDANSRVQFWPPWLPPETSLPDPARPRKKLLPLMLLLRASLSWRPITWGDKTQLSPPRATLLWWRMQKRTEARICTLLTSIWLVFVFNFQMFRLFFPVF